MIEYKIQQEENAKELYVKKQNEMKKLRNIVFETREAEANVRYKVQLAAQKKI